MSQKVVIERVLIRGAAPYVGMCVASDGRQIPLYSTNPDIVMRWLCDGWRCRYNQLRSRRTKWDKNLGMSIPLGGKPDMRSDRQVRLECSWFAAIPAMVLQSPNRIENTDWWSANRRRKTLKKKHRNPGMTPRFKKRRDDLYFVCWHNKGANANYRQLNRHHGEVVITGQNPGAYRLDGQPCRYSIHIRVRVSQPIRDYTSVGVNWTKRTLVFVNDPLPIRRERTGAMVGLGGIADKLEYKTKIADDSLLILVNPAYTSQTCSECGHCERNNRESQAVFHCKKCDMRMNADLNAAQNILDRGWRQLSGSDGAGHATMTQDVHPAYRGVDAAIGACGTSAS